MSRSFDLGKKGEALAADFLVKKGYKILERNFRSGKCEVDIIAKDGQTLVFVEVKTRQTDYFGEPEVWVTPSKQKLLIRAANAYIRLKSFKIETRFDVVSIVSNEMRTEMRHIPDAFYPVM